MSIGRFAEDDRLDSGPDGDEPHGLYPDAGLLRAIRRRSWVGGGLAATELMNWFGHNSVTQSAAHYAALPLAIFFGLDMTWALLARCYRSIRRKIIIIDFTEDGRRETGGGHAGPKRSDQPDQRE